MSEELFNLELLLISVSYILIFLSYDLGLFFFKFLIVHYNQSTVLSYLRLKPVKLFKYSSFANLSL